MNTYTYSVADDTKNGKFDSDSLTAEIRASVIVTALEGVASVGDVLNIFFKAALSEGDEGVLDTVVGNHEGTFITPIMPVVMTDGSGVASLSADGVPQVNSIPAVDSKMACFFPSAANAVTTASPNVDYEVVEAFVQMAGIEVEVDGAELFDSICLQVGMVVGGEWVTVNEYGGKKLITSYWQMCHLSPLRSNAIPQGLTLRVKYVFSNEQTANSPKVSVLYHLWRPYAP